MQVGDERATVILAIDTSLSMEADDVRPTRLEVAQEAARAFVEDLPDELNVGLVTFNGTPTVAVAPTRDREALTAAIDAVELGEGTAIGEAVFTSLDAVAGAPGGENGEPAPARIVVMSDGETTTGSRRRRGARLRPRTPASRSTRSPSAPRTGRSRTRTAGSSPCPWRPSRSRSSRRRRAATAFEADSLDELGAAYADIGGVVGYDEVERDVSGWFVGGGIALLALAGALSLRWSQRLP